tara:strand:+ start:53994 stop:56732 length:2739 start_codon:yes stop_codon:yes gene_type:complete
MNKKLLRTILSIAIVGIVYFVGFHKKDIDISKEKVVIAKADNQVKKTKKTPEERALFAQERLEHELNFQRNPNTGKIPLEEKEQEFQNAMNAKDVAAFNRKSSRTYTSRGPSNLGGRTRAIQVDLSDNTSNTIIAGGVSSGLFRTTNGGTSWTKVSPNDDIHNVTAIAQDPRVGSQNIWYYATGEARGNSASIGFTHHGRGVWKSTDNGITWAQIAATNSSQDAFDTRIDFITAIEVNPITGDLMIAALNRIYRFNGTTLFTEIEDNSGTNTASLTDVVINSAGRVFVAFNGAATTHNGVWTSPTGAGSWTRIAQNGAPTGWAATGRIVLGIAPSNNDVIYALYNNGKSNNPPSSPQIEADLWKYDMSSGTWTNYSSKLPDEPGDDSRGNDPFSIQGGYDLVVSVKPDDEDFVLIGGTNVYKINDIITDATFTRIGGYANNGGYALYQQLGSDEHHSDIHELHFDPHNSSRLFSGTDGGVHSTPNVGFAQIGWTSLNNNYLTYQYYHVAMDPLSGSNFIIGGAQDNGTTVGGTGFNSLPNNTQMTDVFSGDGVAVGFARRNSDADIQLYVGAQLGTFWTNFPAWRDIEPTGSSSQFVTYFYLDPDNTNALYFAGETRLYKTADAENVTTGTWDDLGAVTGNELRTFATSRGAYSASSYLLIGDDGGQIFRLNDPQNATIASTPVDITPAGASTTAGTIVSGLAVHPTNPDIVLATYANYGITNIFVTTNATSATPTWTAIERNLTSHSVRSAAITVVGGQTIYFVGTARGLYSSADPTTTDWEIEGGTVMGFPVVSGLVYRPSDNRMLVGTHGNGMYETTIVANTLSTNDVTNNKLGASIYPNPAQNELNISGSEIDFNSDVKYQISDITGKLIQRGVLSNKKVDVSALNRGLYIINIESKGVNGSLKFLKE